MRKDCDGETKTGEKTGKMEKTDENSGHYVIASSRPPERRPLERRTLAPIAVLALAAGIKVFGSQKIFWIYVYWGCGSFLFYKLFSVSIQKTEK